MSKIEYKILGESHSEFIGIELYGIEQGVKVDLEELQKFVDRRRASKSIYSTTRNEADRIIIESGIKDGVTTGGVILAKIFNNSYRSNDYDALKYCPRPSHADYPAKIKYGLEHSLIGGGKYSGRMTAVMCIAGGIAKQILCSRGIEVGAYISQIGTIKGRSYKGGCVDKQLVFSVNENAFPLLDASFYSMMEGKIEKAKADGDSIGGVVECIAYGLEAGFGNTFEQSLESLISSKLFAIPAVKGVEFGLGFSICELCGSEANDQLYFEGNAVKTKTNNNGGINGGMSNGMPLQLAVAIKPTPSISKEQETVNLQTMTNTTIKIPGRHDSCIVPRVVPVVEAMVCLALYDSMLSEG